MKFTSSFSKVLFALEPISSIQLKVMPAKFMSAIAFNFSTLVTLLCVIINATSTIKRTYIPAVLR